MNSDKPPRDLSHRMRPFDIHYPASFSDGVDQNNRCGCGALMIINPLCHYKIHWYGGHRSNTRAEIMALLGLLWLTKQLYIDKIWIFGDSKVLIDHMNNLNSMSTGHLTTWMDRIQEIPRNFSHIIFKHIYREKNNIADRLSKKGLHGTFREMHYELTDASGNGAKGTVNFFKTAYSSNGDASCTKKENTQGKFADTHIRWKIHISCLEDCLFCYRTFFFGHYHTGHICNGLEHLTHTMDIGGFSSCIFQMSISNSNFNWQNQTLFCRTLWEHLFIWYIVTMIHIECFWHGVSLQFVFVETILVLVSDMGYILWIFLYVTFWNNYECEPTI